MIRHTPGPWSFATFSDGRPCGCFLDSAGKRLPFDSCGMGLHTPSRWDWAESERQANISLMVAAPEMLTALYVFRKVLEKNIESATAANDKEAAFTIKSNLYALNTIIAKAEGKL